MMLVLQDLHQWYDDMESHGPNYGYFINVSKCFLLLKDCCSAGTDLFEGTGVNVCNDGRRYLGSVIGTDDFVFVSKQLQTWHDDYHYLPMSLRLNLMPHISIVLPLPFPICFQLWIH